MNLSDITEVRDIPLRSTFMSDSELCPRKGLFRHRAGLVLRGAKAPALQRGGMFHNVVADLLRGKTRDQAEHAAFALMDAALKEMPELVTPAGYLPSGKTPEEYAKTLESDTRVAVAMSRAYSRFFEVGPGTINGMGVLRDAIEIRVDGDEAGTLDVIVEDAAHGECWIVDHKTSSWNLADYARTLPLSAQSLLYPRLASRMDELQDLRVAGICFNIIKTPAIRCCRTDGFDLSRYADRVEKWYEENPDDTMLRTYIRPSAELTKLSQPRLDNAATACVSLSVLESFPATGGSACQAYNTLCPYLGLCTRDTAGWPEELKRYDHDWRDEQDESGN